MKAVGESMELPLLYYKNNLIGMLNLLEVMERFDCYQLVFSSSCTIYGEPTNLPITEDHSIGGNITNVYGKTKYFIEEMLRDVVHANKVYFQKPELSCLLLCNIAEVEYNRAAILQSSWSSSFWTYG